MTYILFPDNDDNLNDTVRAFAEDERSGLITAERDKWAAGQLIVAVGLDPRRMGVYCGDDVCASVGIYDSGRLDGILDRMEGPLRDGNWAAGLLQGAIASGDPSARRDGGSGGSGGSGDGGAGWLGWAIGGGAGALALGVGGMAVASMRRKQVADARDQFDEVQRDYGRVAQDLQAIDVRAHSLTSPLANDALRGQWEEVKTGFLGLDATFDELDGLTADADDAEFRRRRTAIATAHEQVTRMRTAEENIETLARMEHGDAEVRRRELTEMHEDALAAQVSLEDPTLKEQLGALDPGSSTCAPDRIPPTFMDEFADLISAHRVFVEAAQRHLYAESGVDESEDDDRRAPAVWESSWRPGYGYGNYIPFGIVHLVALPGPAGRRIRGLLILCDDRVLGRRLLRRRRVAGVLATSSLVKPRGARRHGRRPGRPGRRADGRRRPRAHRRGDGRSRCPCPRWRRRASGRSGAPAGRPPRPCPGRRRRRGRPGSGPGDG
ncbi:DUF5129 domain-containing protein [Corynebacterium suedekumii]|nr:DUF5129 domain-containing protein [Corynebacterium suedekumii]